MGKFASPEKLAVAPAPVGAIDMDTSFMLPHYRKSKGKLVQGRLGLGIPTAEFDHAPVLELVEEMARLRRGPPYRSLRGAHDAFKFKTEEYWSALQEASAKAKARKKAVEEREKSGKKIKKRKKRKAKTLLRIVSIRPIKRESPDVGQTKVLFVPKVVITDDRDRIQNLRFGPTPAGFIKMER